MGCWLEQPYVFDRRMLGRRQFMGLIKHGQLQGMNCHWNYSTHGIFHIHEKAGFETVAGAVHRVHLDYQRFSDCRQIQTAQRHERTIQCFGISGTYGQMGMQPGHKEIGIPFTIWTVMRPQSRLRMMVIIRMGILWRKLRVSVGTLRYDCFSLQKQLPKSIVLTMESLRRQNRSYAGT